MLHRRQEKNIVLVKDCGKPMHALVRLDVTLDENSKVVPASAIYSLIPVTEDFQPDAEVEAQLLQYRKELPEKSVVGITEKEWDLINATFRRHESTAANLITGTICTKFKVDFVLFNR